MEWLGEGRARVTARLSVDELAELFGVKIEAEDVETVGGLLAQRLGRVPIAGSTATVAGLRLTAESLAGRRNRIGTVTVRRGSGDRRRAGRAASGQQAASAETGRRRAPASRSAAAGDAGSARGRRRRLAQAANAAGARTASQRAAQVRTPVRHGARCADSERQDAAG